MAVGMMPAAMIWLTALAASSSELKTARIARQSCGFGVKRTQILVTMAKVPSLPTSTPIRSSRQATGQVRSAANALGQSGMGPPFRRPKLDDRAVVEHGLEAEDVIDRHAVLERVRAAGVGGHVAADGAGALARRVGGEVIAACRPGPG